MALGGRFPAGAAGRVRGPGPATHEELMLRAHPEYRPAVLGGAVILVLVVVVTWAVAAGAGRTGSPAVSATAGARAPAWGGPAGAAPSAGATPSGPLTSAVEVGRQFTLAYVDYDYRSGPPSGDAVKPYSTPRLYAQVAQSGQDTAGNPAPWTAITSGSGEVVTATIVSATGQLADSDHAAVQVVVSERDASSGGSWSGERQEDLGLVRDGAQWLVDQVIQVAAEHS